MQIQIPICKKDYLNHISSIYHTSKIIRSKYSSVDRLDENRNNVSEIDEPKFQSPRQTISKVNSMESMVSVGNQSRISVETKSSVTKKPVPNVFDDQIFSFIDNNRENQLMLSENTTTSTPPLQSNALNVSDNGSQASNVTRPIEIVTCETINKGIIGDSAKFKPMIAYAYNSLFEKFPHLRPCDNILTPLNEKIQLIPNNTKQIRSRDPTPQRNMHNKPDKNYQPAAKNGPKEVQKPKPQQNANHGSNKNLSKLNQQQQKSHQAQQHQPKQPQQQKSPQQHKPKNENAKPAAPANPQPSTSDSMNPFNQIAALPGMTTEATETLMSLLAQISQQKGKDAINNSATDTSTGAVPKQKSPENKIEKGNK